MDTPNRYFFSAFAVIVHNVNYNRAVGTLDKP